MPKTSCIRPAVSVECRLVTDTQTDKHRPKAGTAPAWRLADENCGGDRQQCLHVQLSNGYLFIYLAYVVFISVTVYKTEIMHVCCYALICNYH